MKRGILGVLIIVISFLTFFIPGVYLNKFSAGFLFFLFGMGVIILSESIISKYANYSLLKKILASKRNLISFIIVSFFGGLLLEIIACFLGKLWIYPYWNFLTYLLLFVPGFAFYWLIICESYLATKSAMDFFSKGKKYVTKSFKFEKIIFNLVGFCGIILFILAILFIYLNFNQTNKLFGIEDLNSVTNNYVPSFIYIILLFFGMWFILEYIEHHEKRTSLIKDILHNYKTPLLAILFGSFLLGLFMELQNIPSQLWTYINWPFQEITFLGLPIVMLVVWPLHYIFFLSLFRALTDKESISIWRGDLIK